VDEAMEVLDEQDPKSLKKAKAVMLDGEQAQAVLREAYKLKASAFRGKQKKSIKVIPFPHHCEQRDANKYVPSGSSVWRPLQRAGWCGHNPPYVRVSASFRKSG